MWKQRTANCGELRLENQFQNVILNGWVATVRDMGMLIFIDLRDRYGISQLVVETDNSPDLAIKIREAKTEFVVWAEGIVRKRENPNSKILTGLIEILVVDFGIINKAELPPFEIIDDLATSEEQRLKFRYLDLRRPILQNNFIIRNKLYQITHQYFYENNFIELETPVLMKSTPEGARDFLVPSRINKGKFYALPQSPQIFKQILMIAGY
ncbi:MAG: OB-fold nucleic acid binding domain-containing protein, partial [Candidatus Kapabacteria bacterium]|nr:OB-fold nucleic acid binding domain-containing protein [Candidatus Kapabacteria bacterium]